MSRQDHLNWVGETKTFCDLATDEATSAPVTSRQIRDLTYQKAILLTMCESCRDIIGRIKS